MQQSIFQGMIIIYTISVCLEISAIITLIIMKIYKTPQSTQYADQNNSFSINKNTQTNKKSTQESTKISQIRKQYVEKMRTMQTAHQLQIKNLQEIHQTHKKDILQRHRTQIAQKDAYIKMLQQMVQNKPAQKTMPVKTKVIDETKYFHTENNRNYVPFFEDISERIDFKIYRNIQDKISQTNQTKKQIQESTLPHSLSKHKLIPKGKPSQPVIWDNINIKFPTRKMSLRNRP